MGCDIHMFVEIKIDNNWEYWSEINIPRDYEFFAAISEGNYRFQDYKVKKLKFTQGMPKDISRSLKFRLDDVDMHTHTWMDSKQAEKLMESTFEENLKWEIKYLLDKNSYLRKKGMQDFRLVYCFDN